MPRWQRAALDLTDLNLIKEGSDLKKERTGRKSSFSSGLLTSGNLSSVDSARSAIRRRHVIARDLCWPLCWSGCFFYESSTVDLTRSTTDCYPGNSKFVKNLIWSRSGREFPLVQSLSTMRFFVFSCATPVASSKSGISQLVASVNSAFFITVIFLWVCK